MKEIQTLHFEKDSLICKIKTFKIKEGNYGYTMHRTYFKQNQLREINRVVDGFCLKDTLDLAIKEAVKLLKRQGFVENV